MLLPDQAAVAGQEAPCVLCQHPAPAFYSLLSSPPARGLHSVADQEQCIQRAMNNVAPPAPKPAPKPRRASQARKELQQKGAAGQ